MCWESIKIINRLAVNGDQQGSMLSKHMPNLFGEVAIYRVSALWKDINQHIFIWSDRYTAAHADYVAQPQSVATQAARYSVMSISELQSAAKSGQAGAQFYLATRYQYGKDVAKDENKLFTLFKAAADQGLSAAQLNVGRMYADGIGTKKDEALARKYLKKRRVMAITVPALISRWWKSKEKHVGAYQWYELSTRDGMLDTKVISLSEGKKTALAANLTQDQIRTARDRADKWFKHNNLF